MHKFLVFLVFGFNNRSSSCKLRSKFLELFYGKKFEMPRS